MNPVSFGLMLSVALVGGWLEGCQSPEAVLEVQLAQSQLSARVEGQAETTLTLTNSGDADLLIVDVIFQEEPNSELGPQFEVSPYLREHVITSGERQVLAIQFKPRVVGPAQIALVINSTGGTPVIRVGAEGENNPPEVFLSDDFPSSVCAGVMTSFEGSVRDVEDAGVLGTLIATLTSSHEGELVSGQLDADGGFSLETALGIPGTQSIVLSALDSHGGLGEASQRVNVVTGSGDSADCVGVDARSRAGLEARHPTK